MVMALSRPMKRNPNASLAVMIGFEETSAFQRKVGFANDRSIPETRMKVDESKEVAEQQFQQIQKAMRRLMDSEKQGVVRELTS